MKNLAQPRMATFAMMALACTSPIWADTSGTPTFTVGQMLNLDTGATVSAGGDFQFAGSTVIVQSGASWALVPSSGDSAYNALTQASLTSLQYISGSLIGTIPASFVSPGAIAAFKTRGNNYGKVLIVSITPTSLSIKFTTFGVTGGSGGGPSAPSISTIQIKNTIFLRQWIFYHNSFIL